VIDAIGPDPDPISRVAIVPLMHDLPIWMAWSLSQAAVRSRVSSRVAALILADRGIARLGGNFEPLPLQDEIDGRDFIRGPDRVVGNLVNGDYELGHEGPSLHESDAGRLPRIYAGMMPGAAIVLLTAAEGGPGWHSGPTAGRVDRENGVRRRDNWLTLSGP
jgi:hypothetical protein